jgi:hypothetical protein
LDKLATCGRTATIAGVISDKLTAETDATVTRVAEPPPMKVLSWISSHSETGTMSHVDPWDKVAECESAIKIVADPERRVVLDRLRTLWIALGNNQSVDRVERAGHLCTIAQIHAELMLTCRNAMH